jgi:acetylornithine deacetylase/succinyl-diaminopimelate desuccinylase-like protein
VSDRAVPVNRFRCWSYITLLVAGSLSPAAEALGQTAGQLSGAAPYRQLGRAIFTELIATNTTHSTGNTTLAANKLAARFLAAGFPAADVQVIGPNAKNRNLVVRYRGRGTRKPLLFIAHLDVVEAKREDWSIDPFVLTERDGYFYGRGTLDVKGGAAQLVAAMLRLKQEHFVPDRDLILALTAGEESGGDYNGIQWLLANRRALIDAEFCLNVDAGGGEIHQGKLTDYSVQAAEKVYHSVSLTVRNPGGHSSLPTKENAIYRLAAALERLQRFDFPPRLTETTRAYFAASAPLATGQVAADMRAILATPADTVAMRRLSASSFYNAELRTTCVATMITGGHAENALPQLARATVNCRMLPDEKPEDVERTLKRVVNDTLVAVEPLNTAVPSPPSPLSGERLQVLERAVRSVWSNLPIVPIMETGATDGLFLRNAGMPVYGVGGIAYDVDDVRAHGRDERILVSAFNDGLEFLYRLMRTAASPAT